MDATIKPTLRTASDLRGHHHGIRYSLKETARGIWIWAVHPPEGVLGWEPNSGAVKGSRSDAITVVKFEIERQERQAT